MMNQASIPPPDNSLARASLREAITRAAARDLSGALALSQYFPEDDSDAEELIRLCKGEIGEIPLDAAELCRAVDSRRSIRHAIKYTAALSDQSASILTLRGCLFAKTRRYRAARECFALALEKDRGFTIAADGLRAVSMPRRWGLW